MAKSLDVGSMNILSARQEGDETVFVQQRNSFVEIDYSDMAEQMLSRSEVLHIRKGDQVYTGDDALNFANISNGETRRPMRHGILSLNEQSAILMIQLIIEQVVGEPNHRDERLFFSAADPIDTDLSTLYHQKTLESILGDIGYDPNQSTKAWPPSIPNSPIRTSRPRHQLWRRFDQRLSRLLCRPSHALLHRPWWLLDR